MAAEEIKYLGQPGTERLIANLREEISTGDEAQAGALAEHKNDSSVHVAAEEKEALLGAIAHVHEHNNKEVLDNISSVVDIYTQADEPAEPAEDSIWVKDGVNGLPPSILIRKSGVWVMVSDGEAQKQADWNETDGASASYIRNKPFGYFDDLYSNSSLQFDIDNGRNNVYSAPISSELFSGINEGDNVTVIWDSITYNLVAYYSRITDFMTVSNVLGNARIASEFFGTTDGIITGEPFCILPGIGTVYTRSTMASHSVIIKYKDKVVKIDPKYLPDDAFDTNGAATEALEDSKAYTDEKIAGLVLENAQADWNQEDESKPDFIHNKPEIPSIEGLATVEYVDSKLTGGTNAPVSWNDIQDKPEIPEAYTHPESHPASMITGLAAVATSGSYNDLSDQPEIPSVEGLATEDYVDEKIREINVQGGVSGPVSWDDIEDKPFGDFGTVLTEFMPETTLPFNYSENDGGYAFDMTPPSDYIKTWNGDWTEAEVVWDGSTYACQAQYVQGIKCVGNVGLMMGGESTGEPFIMMMADAATVGVDICSIISLVDEAPEDTSNAETKYHDVSVNIYQKNIVKIPLKYSHRPDWNESDSSNGSYIANRPFFTMPSGSVVVPETTVSCDTSVGGDAYYALIDPISDIGAYNYQIDFDGVICEVTARVAADGVSCYFEYNDGTVMFQIDPSGVLMSTQGSHTFKITLLEDAVFKIDEKYLPEIKALPEVTADDNEKILSVVDGVWGVAEHVWDTLKNKPFYEETYSASCSFATTASIPTVKFALDNMTCYKVADFTLSQEQLLQSTFTFNVDENTYVFPITTEHIGVTTDDFALLTIDEFLFMVAYRTGSMEYSGLTWNVPKVGIYACFPDSFTLPSPIDINILYNYAKPIDAKYLPQHLQFGEVEGLVDILPLTTYEDFALNLTFGVYCVFGNPDFTFTIGETYKVYWDGTEYECIAQDASSLLDEGAVVVGDASGFGLFGNNEPFIIEADAYGTVYISITDTESGGSHTVSIAKNGIVTKPIDSKYLPEISSLPEVTTDNNGQVMTVVDGVWAAQSVDRHTELPTVTSTDAGKFLRVSSTGVWVAESIQNAEEASF